MVDADDQEDRRQCQTECHTRALGQPGDVLGDQDCERVDDGGAVSHGVAHTHDPDSRDRIEPESDAQRQDHGDKRQVLLGHPDRAGPDSEHQDAAAHEQRGRVPEASQQEADEGIGRPGRAEDTERAADDEDKEDDLVGRREASRDGREDRERRQARSVDDTRVASGHDDLVPLTIHHLELSGRKQVGECQRHDDHAEEQDECAGRESACAWPWA